MKFYGYLLGMEQVEKPPELAPRGGVWFRGPRSSSTSGSRTGSGPRPRRIRRSWSKAWSTLLTRLDAAGVRVSEDEVQLEGFHRVYVRDPFGNRIELIEPI